MMADLSIFTFRANSEMVKRARAMRDKTRATNSLIVQLALEKWINDEWTLHGDEGPLDSQVLIYLAPDVMKRAMEKRGQTGISLSAIARDALRRWANGEVQVVLDGPQ